VIEIEVGLHDVADVAGIESQVLDLADRGQGGVNGRLGVAEGEAAAEPRADVGVVGGAKTGVDEHEAGGRRLDEQDMTGQRQAAEFHSLDVSAVEVVDAKVGHASTTPGDGMTDDVGF
jgi:hypothetical protein